jgi:hypothetical protein
VPAQYAAVVHTAPFSGPFITYNGSVSATVPGAAQSDFVVSGGAAVQPEGSAGALVLRSGEPHTTSSAVFAAHVTASPEGTGVITAVSFSYSYASGFNATGLASNFSLVALAVDPCIDGPGPQLAVIYVSPPLAGFPYDACDDYSPMEPEGFLAAGECDGKVQCS